MPGPVSNERVRRLLQDRLCPCNEPGFDAFDTERFCTPSTATTPKEELAKGSLADWYPRSQWLVKDVRARLRPDGGPFGREYTSGV